MFKETRHHELRGSEQRSEVCPAATAGYWQSRRTWSVSTPNGRLRRSGHDGE